MWGCGDPGGAAAATVVLSGTRDCFLHLPPALASLLRLQQVPGRRRSGPGGGTPEAGREDYVATEMQSPRPLPHSALPAAETPHRETSGNPSFSLLLRGPVSSSIANKTRERLEFLFPSVVWRCGHLRLSQHSLFHSSFPSSLPA